MVVPDKKLIYLLFVPFIIIILSFKFSFMLSAAILIDIFIILIVLVDGIVSYYLLNLEISIDIKEKPVFQLNCESLLSIVIKNKTKISSKVVFTLSKLEEVKFDKNYYTIKIKPLTVDRINLMFIPKRRGRYCFKYVFFQTDSILGLLKINKKNKIDFCIKVIADIRDLKKYFSLLRGNKLSEMGVKKSTYTGQSKEFAFLKEYMQDEDAKLIDWKASTRLIKPVSKVYQIETSNNIVFALDCGRLMGAEQDGLSTLDYAINTISMFTGIALKNNDVVNIIAFSDSIKGHLRKINGKSGIARVLNFFVDIQPEIVEPNYNIAFNYIYKNIKKRSLVIVITNIVDNLNYNIFIKYFPLLLKKHYLLFVFFRDKTLENIASNNFNVESSNINLNNFSNEDKILLTTAARDLVLNRYKTIKKIKKYGINVIDILPDKFTPSLLNKYFEIKMKNMI